MKIKGSSAKPLVLLAIGAVVLFHKLGLSKLSAPPTALFTTDAFFFFDNDFYGALALPFDAPSATVKIAHESLSAKYNPEHSHYDGYKPEAKHKIATRHNEIQQAFKVLNDKTRRRAYVSFVKALPKEWRPVYDSGNLSSSTIVGVVISGVIVLLTTFSGLELAAFKQERDDILTSKEFLKAQAKATAKGVSKEAFLAEYTNTEKPELEYGAADTLVARLVLWPLKLVGVVSSKPSAAERLATATADKKANEARTVNAAKELKEKASRERRAAAEARRAAAAETKLKADRDRRRAGRVEGLTDDQMQALCDSGAAALLLSDQVGDGPLKAQKQVWSKLLDEGAKDVDWTPFDETFEALDERARQEHQARIDAEQEAMDEEQRKAAAALYTDDDVLGSQSRSNNSKKKNKKKNKKSASDYIATTPAVLVSGTVEAADDVGGEIGEVESSNAVESDQDDDKEEDEWEAAEAAAASAKLQKKEMAKIAKAAQAEKNRLLNEERKKLAKETGAGGGGKKERRMR